MEAKKWHVIQVVELTASAKEVWGLVGGFFTIHTWHPDIATTEIPLDQTSQHEIRRFLTFPGPPISTTTEQLIFTSGMRENGVKKSKITTLKLEY